MNHKAAPKTANAEKVYHVKKQDLPLSCPSADMALWNSHPKVYLSVEKTGEAVCEYCGAKYILDAE
ncbi:MAG: zinc-finger domain-containing protein [Marinicella sp.]|nr:zinc-finger domain-containing protein [Xanthomonadales bacterium]